MRAHETLYGGDISILLLLHVSCSVVCVCVCVCVSVTGLLPATLSLSLSIDDEGDVDQARSNKVPGVRASPRVPVHQCNGPINPARATRMILNPIGPPIG